MDFGRRRQEPGKVRGTLRPPETTLGQTRVDLEHLLEDIRDAYPGSLEETIVTEVVANSLDSGATTVHLLAHPAEATLTVVDDGSGMAKRDLARYHDIAASTKAKGEGIGFAGVGIKLGILASEEVLTETRRGASHVASSWHLASRHKAPWRWVAPPGLVGAQGTAVRLKLRNPLSPLLESGFLEATLRRHFQPLFDLAFAEILSDQYPAGVRFVVNGHALAVAGPSTERASLAIRVGRKRRPSAAGFLERRADPLPDDAPGVAISTLGKVIKRGWDWLGLSPAHADRIHGLLEVPALAGCLTLNKADFVRAGSRGALYLAHRKAMQEAVSAQLAAWGDAPEDEAEESARRRKTRPVERDLAAVLLDLAADFPLVASLVERKAGGQKRLAMGPGSSAEVASGSGSAEAETGPGAGSLEAADPGARAAPAGPPLGFSPAGEPADRAPDAGGDDGTSPSAETPEHADRPPAEGAGAGGLGDAIGHVDWPSRGGKRRPARLGLGIQFENRPDDPELGRLVDSTVWVNDAHPAYLRAAASRAEGYHIALTVAMALAPLAVEPAQTHAFVTAFLARWGETLERPLARRRPRRRGKPGPP